MVRHCCCYLLLDLRRSKSPNERSAYCVVIVIIIFVVVVNRVLVLLSERLSANANDKNRMRQPRLEFFENSLFTEHQHNYIVLSKELSCRRWIDYVNRPELAYNSPEHLHNNYRLCAMHFREDDFVSLGNHARLKRHVVPSVPPPADWKHANDIEDTDDSKVLPHLVIVPGSHSPKALNADLNRRKS
ncbi:uncharacterized protein LOC111263435 isoform X2 [Varroa jacobsoni]|uniref:THAP-type domain-containing protein n=1 Tax=Varroa destructor TaxID=109461 RepID=A0A7M7KFG1_VARDE|nr:uncharacterized protein LOC111252020 isoform X2 [Varroa destructor]XP_022694231.1 uncharacterized protein LOC111263435 isoform X2 [Varroa jacobsoni]